MKYQKMGLLLLICLLILSFVWYEETDYMDVVPDTEKSINNELEIKTYSNKDLGIAHFYLGFLPLKNIALLSYFVLNYLFAL